MSPGIRQQYLYKNSWNEAIIRKTLSLKVLRDGERDQQVRFIFVFRICCLLVTEDEHCSSIVYISSSNILLPHHLIKDNSSESWIPF